MYDTCNVLHNPSFDQPNIEPTFSDANDGKSDRYTVSFEHILILLNLCWCGRQTIYVGMVDRREAFKIGSCNVLLQFKILFKGSISL